MGREEGREGVWGRGEQDVDADLIGSGGLGRNGPGKRCRGRGRQKWEKRGRSVSKGIAGRSGENSRGRRNQWGVFSIA